MDLINERKQMELEDLRSLSRDLMYIVDSLRMQTNQDGITLRSQKQIIQNLEN